MLAKDMIIDYRAKKGITQNEMAKLLGLSRITVASIEQGSQLSILTKGKVAKFFDVDVNEVN